MKDYKFKMNIKAIMLFEQMTGIVYSEIDYNDLVLTTKLLYCCVIANNNIIHTYNDFIILLENKKFASEITSKLKNEVSFNEQFSYKEEGTKDPDNSRIGISDIIPILTNQCNLDVNYVMNEMNLFEVRLHLDNFNKREQSNLEMSRLWTYYQMLPHIDSKKLKSPKDLIKFNWEDTKEAIESITEDTFNNMIDSCPIKNK